MITANFRFIIFGFYPYELHWRPSVAMIILVSLLFYKQKQESFGRLLVYVWMPACDHGHSDAGRILGLTPVESASVGAFASDTDALVFGMLRPIPLGIFLALGRRSKMPAIRTISILYIEKIRAFR